jgi:hypothetical protein
MLCNESEGWSWLPTACSEHRKLCNLVPVMRDRYGAETDTWAQASTK